MLEDVPPLPNQGIICFWCKGVYKGIRPFQHICSDGTTYIDRLAKAGQVGDNKYHYGDEGAKKFDLRLTDLDIAWLKGIKIRPF
jgi:hypothetical protein